MQFIYFTKTLKELAPLALVEFCKETGVDGLDLAVRPGYPIEPGNVLHDPAAKGQDFALAVDQAATQYAVSNRSCKRPARPG